MQPAINSSPPVKDLHQQLKGLFVLLDQTVKEPFDQEHRTVVYQQALKELKEIINTHYVQEDAQDIQTRLRNQQQGEHNNYLTGLLYAGVPLTNNVAERNLRPLVVLRKVSGGSKSVDGAKTTAVNMSIYQTVKLQNLPLFDTLKQYLIESTR